MILTQTWFCSCLRYSLRRGCLGSSGCSLSSTFVKHHQKILQFFVGGATPAGLLSRIQTQIRSDRPLIFAFTDPFASSYRHLKLSFDVRSSCYYLLTALFLYLSIYISIHPFCLCPPPKTCLMNLPSLLYFSLIFSLAPGFCVSLISLSSLLATLSAGTCATSFYYK